MSYLTPTDFEAGEFSIAQGFQDDGAKLQEYIDHYETQYMNRLLGAALFTLFEADGNPPANPAYLKIFDPLAFDSEMLCKPMTSEGVLIMLKCFIYAHYRKQDLGVPTTAGQVEIQPEGGQLAKDEYADYYSKVNRGVRSAKAIRQWICENMDDFEEYKGVEFKTVWLV